MIIFARAPVPEHAIETSRSMSDRGFPSSEGPSRTRRPQPFEVRGRKIEKFFHGVSQQAPIVPLVRSFRHFIFTVLDPKKDLGNFVEILDFLGKSSPRCCRYLPNAADPHAFFLHFQFFGIFWNFLTENVDFLSFSADFREFAAELSSEMLPTPDRSPPAKPPTATPSAAGGGLVDGR